MEVTGHTWLVPQDSVKTEFRWDLAGASTRLAAATTKRLRCRGHRARPLMDFLRLLSNTVGELIDVDIRRFLVPREPGWELHLEVYFEFTRMEVMQSSGTQKKKGVGKCPRPYT
jgi:hypothetical protein